MSSLTFKLRRDGQENHLVTICPRTTEDHTEIMEFYKGISPEEQEFFVADVTDPKIVSTWFEQNEFVETRSLIARSETTIVGEAILMRQKNPHVAHVGSIQFFIYDQWRKAGLGACLVSELFSIAMKIGIEKISVFLPAQAAARYETMLLRNGFSKEAVLKQHYRSNSGAKSDIIIYGRDLEELWHRISDWVTEYGRAMEY